MSLWDTVCQNVSNVFDSVKEGSKAVKDALIKAKKEADKATIRNVMAPAKMLLVMVLRRLLIVK